LEASTGKWKNIADVNAGEDILGVLRSGKRQFETLLKNVGAFVVSSHL
jgi:hypothetical protein